VAFTYKLRGQPVTLTHLEDIVALRAKETLRRRETPGKILKRFNTATVKDDAHGEIMGLKLPGRGRKAFEKMGWLFCEAEKKLARAANSRIRPAETEAVMPVFVDRGGNTLVGTNLLVVQLPPDLSEKQAMEQLKSEGLKHVRTLKFAKNLFEASLPARKPFAEAIADLQSSNAFVFAEPSFLRVLTGRFTPDDPHFSEQWQHKNTQMEKAWDRSKGTGVRVTVIDNGMQVNHPDLKDGIKGGGYFDSDGFGNATFLRFDDPSGSFPSNDHGTFCLGMVGARANGIGGCGSAFEADLRPVGCLSDQIGTQATLARAVAYAANPSLEDSTATAADGADVVACSLGPSSGAAWDLTSVLDLALKSAASQGRGGRGLCIFWAVSNGSVDISLDHVVSHPDVLAIGRSNSSDLADGSAFGPKLEFLAPGRDVFSTMGGGGFGIETGTSFACPFAAGVAALILARAPNLTRDEVRDRLRHSCDQVQVGGVTYDANGHNDDYGYGRINGDRAVP
jgi:subtilisin family serine protease